MNPSQIIRILRARWKTAWAVFVLVSIAALVAALLLPKQYTAETTLLDDSHGPDPIYGEAGQYVDPATHIATQVDVITSDRVAKRVFDMLSLDKDPKLIEDYQKAGSGHGTLEQYAVEKMSKALEVKASGESNVIAIRYTARDPTFAANAANAFANAYIETVTGMRIDTARSSSRFFDAHARELRDKLMAAQQRVAKYQEDHGIIVTDEKMDIENSRLAELSSQLTALQGLRADSASRQAQAQLSANGSMDVSQSPVVEQLRADVARAQVHLDELAKTLGHNHPQYIAAEAELDSLNARLQNEMRRVTSTLGAANAVNQQREAEIKAQLDAQKKKVLDMRVFHDQAAVLQRDVDDAQRAYDAVTQRLSQTDLARQDRSTTASVLAEADPPVKPSKPRKLLTLAVSMVAGIVLGIGAALGMEVLDGRMRIADDLAELYRMPVLISLPSARMSRAMRSLARPDPRLALPGPDGA